MCRAAWRVGVSIREYRSFEAGEPIHDFETWDRMATYVLVAGLALTGISLTSERRGCTALVFETLREEMGQHEAFVRGLAWERRRLKRIVSLLIVVAVAAACDRCRGLDGFLLRLSRRGFGAERRSRSGRRPRRSKMIDDPVGDSIPETSPFMDTVAYGVDWVGNDEQEGGTFLFRFEVAAPIPDSFQVPMGRRSPVFVLPRQRSLDQSRRVPVRQQRPGVVRVRTHGGLRRVVLGPAR